MSYLTPFEARTLELLLVEQEVVLMKKRALVLGELSVEGREPKPRDTRARTLLDHEEALLLERQEAILVAAKARFAKSL